MTPAVPQELDDRNHDREANARDCAKNGDARETDDRKPELLALNPIKSAQTRHLDQADRRGDDDAYQRHIGKMLQEARSGDQEEATASAPTTPVNCVRDPAASATGVRDELLLMGNPWKNPAARFATPSSIIS